MVDQLQTAISMIGRERVREAGRLPRLFFFFTDSVCVDDGVCAVWGCRPEELSWP